MATRHRSQYTHHDRRNAAPTAERRTYALLSLIVAVAALPFLASCGGGGDGGSNIIGDLTTDLNITSDMSVPSELRAKNLTIAPGVTVSSPGDLKIQTAGLVTLNGTISPTGGLTMITPAGMDVGANGGISGGSGHVIFVSDPSFVPTDAEMDAEFAKGSTVGGSRVHRGRPAPSAGRAGRAGSTYHVPITTWKPGTHGKHNIWIDVDGTASLGRPGQNTVQNALPGDNGADDVNKNCNATGTNGSVGSSLFCSVDSLAIDGSYTLNLGAGGNGGNASTKADCCPAIAKGGKGGNTGTARIVAGNGIEVNAALTVNYGNGGAGGAATASSKDNSANSACPAASPCSATTTGGVGGIGAFPASSSGNVSGNGTVTCNGGSGGVGGAANSTGGAGGTSTCCPAGIGGAGGSATGTGGAGGNAQASVSGVVIQGGGFVAGNGGNATANGGKGGAGSSCCTPPAQGGKGGPGGAATATVGLAGAGTNGAPTNGNATGKAGDGGHGGDGNPVGAGGNAGVGTGVPNGTAGAPGAVCPGGGGGCTQEQEPNNTEGTGTQLDGPTQVGNAANGCGTLSNANDLDHFKVALSTGTYRINVTQAPAGAGLFLHVGTNASSTPPINQPVTFTVTGNNVNVVIGFFGATGAYQFTLTKTQ
jgi:hypothetical protein